MTCTPSTPRPGSTRTMYRARARLNTTTIICSGEKRFGLLNARYAIRWSPMVVLPDPAPPWITARPECGRVMSSN
nr:hypothetical protein [Deltaproteobacteria bacterium]